MNENYKTIQVNPLSPALGAEIGNEESQPLLDYLYAHARQNEFTCRFNWRKSSMAIWDNRATQHCALNDYHGERRLMHRITIDGAELEAAAA